jgi:hypothetical protein
VTTAEVLVGQARILEGVALRVAITTTDTFSRGQVSGFRCSARQLRRAAADQQLTADLDAVSPAERHLILTGLQP